MQTSVIRSRTLARTVHVLFALMLGAAVYAPIEVILPFRAMFQWVVLPVAGASGLWMWFQPKVFASLRRARLQQAA